jgi:hypothetical protein
MTYHLVVWFVFPDAVALSTEQPAMKVIGWPKPEIHTLSVEQTV